MTRPNQVYIVCFNIFEKTVRICHIPDFLYSSLFAIVNMTRSTDSQSVPRVKALEGAQRIVETMRHSGGVVVEGFLTPDQAQKLNEDLDAPFATMDMGSKSANPAIQRFHGSRTKRVTNLVTHSTVFREEVLDYDLLYDILDLVFIEEDKSYWMSGAQAIEISPGNEAQKLHRDQGQFRVFDVMGPSAPEAAVNLLIAVTDFTEENGATRVIPGSHKWPDFTKTGHPDDTLPAEMKAGDVLVMSGKTVHGGGANRTASEKRRGVACLFTCSYLTPEEAHPFQTNLETVRTMSRRAQRSLGYRSQFPKGSDGLWQWNFGELADHIGL